MNTHDCQILVGDALDKLKTLPDESVDCVVTSVPYWGLRDYGVDGQHGLEETFEEHLDVLVNKVFREVHRVLKPEGTCFVNYGDCYAATPAGQRTGADGRVRTDKDDRTFTNRPISSIGGVRKPKDLCMMPNRFAIAMQEWNTTLPRCHPDYKKRWWVRSEIIWAKPNPMPDTVRDRPAGSHEKIWLFTKAPRYFWDKDAVKRPVSDKTNPRVSKSLAQTEALHRASGGAATTGPAQVMVANSTRKVADEDQTKVRRKASLEAALSLMVDKRNLRNYEPAHFEVWEIASRAFPQAHFATFPEELARRCIAAGCPIDGVVLDSYGGAGTTALAAKNLGRKSILIELNPNYAAMAASRLRLSLCSVSGVEKEASDAGPLFSGEVL